MNRNPRRALTRRRAPDAGRGRLHGHHGAAEEHGHRRQRLQRPRLVPGLPRQDLRRPRGQRPAGAGRGRGHPGHRRGVLPVPASLLGGAGAADRRGGDRLGRRGHPGDEHPALGLDQLRSSSPCTTGSTSRSAWRTSSCARPPTRSWRERNVSARARGRDRRYPRRGPVPPRAELLARDRPVRQHPAGDRGGSARAHSAAPEHPRRRSTISS